MAEVQRGLIQLLQDLDRRARVGRPSRYRAIQKYVNVADTVVLSSDTQTLSVFDTPMQWQTASATSLGMNWDEFEWSA